MDIENVKAELSRPGEGYRAAVALVDREFAGRMDEAGGDLSTALGKVLDASMSDTALRGAIILRFLCAFGAEARAAQPLFSMSPAEREQQASKLFSDRFQEALKSSSGDLELACGQLLQDAFCDAQLNAAIVSNHIAYFKEGMMQRPRGKGTAN